MQQKLYTYTGLLFVLIFCCFTSLQAQDYLPEKPKVQTSVYDYAQMMSGFEAKSLEQKLIRYNDTTSTQIVVITVKSLEGNEVALYATELAHKWGIGQADTDNGVLILASKDDRKITIRTGYGVEHLLTDALSRRIIENIIKPEFRQGNFYGGFDKSTSAIMEIMNGEYQGTPQQDSYEGGEGIPFGLIIIIFFIIMMILSRRNRKGGGKNGGRKSGGFSLLDAIILSNAGRGGYGGRGFGGGSSGGGFGGGGFGGGFGGGGFGGGGASGGW